MKNLHLETEQKNLSMRIMDLMCPIGKGQRGLISLLNQKPVKQFLLQQIANSIRKNHPKTKMIILLIDERPEEVTDMKRSVDAEVLSSTFDEAPERHVAVADMAFKKPNEWLSMEMMLLFY